MLKFLIYDFTCCLMLFALYSCASTPAASPEMKIETSPGRGCEQYRERATGLTDPAERGRALKAYNLCQAAVIRLAGDYDASIVRHAETSRERDRADPDFVLHRDTFCLFAPNGEVLPKCFVIPYRHYSPSAWSLFKRDAVRVAFGAAVGYGAALAKKTLWVLLFW